MVKKSSAALCIYACIFGASVASSPVTFELLTGEQECLYVEASDNSVISYYFAVQHSWSGKSDVDHEIFGPGDDTNPMFASLRESQGEWSFRAHTAGEYRFCFRAPVSSCILDVQILVKSGNLGGIPNEHVPSLPGHFVDPLQDTWARSLDLIERQLKVLETNMQRYKIRTIRNGTTVVSIASRAKLLAICGSLFIVCIVYCQTKLLKRRIKSLLSNRK
ncbi:Erp3p LALA0_S01e01376g [Lachancea lanzarotensis]|uniref:LALA0S01e01376g1_1 n=1 Tax=Lachancea lanzarotensis TaxID=1245769 RepID=A0A0C7MJX3_9SACH|nr:uncharacterized protein LALA0_S01e01376g [Lachancea lanzarotensis]CEP60028.1 LALA0S01e01376g1_1 [Lachancea lanzarotensis]